MTEENWEECAKFLQQPENQEDLIIIHVNYNIQNFLYYYNKTLLHASLEGYYNPTIIDKNKIILVDAKDGIRDEHPNLSLPNLKLLNKSLKQVNTFWLVSSNHVKPNYPNNEVVNFISLYFDNMAKYTFGSVWINKYQRKEQ